MTSCDPSPTSVIACDDDAKIEGTNNICSNNTSTIHRVNLNAATQYYVVIGGYARQTFITLPHLS